MLQLMISATGNSTSIHFGANHMCHRHNRLFTLDHIEQCDSLSGCGRIREHANRLKQQHILDWDKETRMVAITDFALLTIQLQNLAEAKEMTLVQTDPPSTYVRKGGKVGRPSNAEKVAKTNTKINEFFPPVINRE